VLEANKMKNDVNYLSASIISSILISLPIAIIIGIALQGDAGSLDLGANQGFGIGIGVGTLSILTTSIFPTLSILALSVLNKLKIINIILFNAFQIFVADLLLLIIISPKLGYNIYQISEWKNDLGKLTLILFGIAEVYSILFQMIWVKIAIGYPIKQKSF
jgi:hypothetical protein